MSYATDRLLELLRTKLTTGRVCVICGQPLPRGEAMPVPPEARDSAEPEWMCLDQHGCDLRWMAAERGRLPGGPGGDVLAMILDMTVPVRLELPAP